MREILFRAKRKDNGEWVEGYVFELQSGQYMICDRNQYDRASTFPAWEFLRYCTHEIYPETLCQYTGLKDKSGKKIWENDIIRVENSVDEGTGVVVFYEGIWYVNRGVNNSLYNIVLYDDEAEIYIIGNIIDNSYMVKKG